MYVLTFLFKWTEEEAVASFVMLYIVLRFSDPYLTN